MRRAAAVLGALLLVAAGLAVEWGIVLLSPHGVQRVVAAVLAVADVGVLGLVLFGWGTAA